MDKYQAMKEMSLKKAIKFWNNDQLEEHPDYQEIIPTDKALWHSREVFNGDDLLYWLSANESYSDSYKDVHGFRPRSNFPTTVSEFKQFYNDLDRMF